MQLRFLRLTMPNTLGARLFVMSSIVSLLGIAAVAFFISANFRSSAEARLEDLLTANMFNLMGNVQLDNKQVLSGAPDLGDSRYSIVDSGWYWSIHQIGNSDNRIASTSLLGAEIKVPPTIQFDDTFQRTFILTDESGQQLSGLEAQVYLGEGNELFSFKITANRDTLEQEIGTFRSTLFLTLMIFAFSIILAMSFLVRVGLRPIARAKRLLGEVRKGELSRIDGQYPDEIQPLIDETNALIQSNNTIVERARTQVGNLAHSLKTPLAVIQNEIDSLPDKKKRILSEQTDTMRQQVQLYLDRARISARSSTAIAYTPLQPELEKLVSVVAKLNSAVKIKENWSGIQGVDFEGERPDLQEIFGNLLENACKYASSQVRISADYSDRLISVVVEDDGEGMSEKQIEKALHRGGRVDEGKSGWGLGLSIVTDIVEEYRGSLQLARSSLGGLKATVMLPGRK